MRVIRRLVAGLAIAALTVVGGPSSATAEPATADPATADPATADPAPTDPATSVTLITGDRLTRLGPDQVAIERGPGRGHVTFAIRKLRDHLHVIPADAVP